jgi:hypothetical protein
MIKLGLLLLEYRFRLAFFLDRRLPQNRILMSCLIPPQLSIRLQPILSKLAINNSAFWGKFGKIKQFYKEFRHGSSNLRKSQVTFGHRFGHSSLAALLYILRRKRHPSIQRKKLYLRMSSVLLNTSILAIYGLWKSSEIVLLTNRSQHLLLTNHSHYVCPCICNA